MDGCVEWTGAKIKLGYGHVWDPVAKKVRRAHRWIWEMTFGEIPSGMMVLHKCDNRACINPCHLYLGDQKENMRDRKERGRAPDFRGLKNPNCKLTDDEILGIRNACRGGMRQVEVARVFGVSQPYVSKVVRMVNRT